MANKSFIECVKYAYWRLITYGSLYLIAKHYVAWYNEEPLDAIIITPSILVILHMLVWGFALFLYYYEPKNDGTF